MKKLTLTNNKAQHTTDLIFTVICYDNTYEQGQTNHATNEDKQMNIQSIGLKTQ